MPTPTIAREIETRRGGPRARTLAGSLSARLLARSYELGAKGAPLTWPSPRYANDIDGFARDVVGVRLWAKQVEIAEAVRAFLDVSVSSGNKCGKTDLCAVCALWFYCTFKSARVLMTAVKKEQLKDVLWKATLRLWRQSGICADCREENERRDERHEARIDRPCPHSVMIDGIAHELPSSGIKARDGREILGFTSRSLEGVSGISGARMFYIVDEASGVKQDVFGAIEGNRMGGNVKKLLTSNPTRTEGEHYESMTSKRDKGEGGYQAFRISGEETPNFVERRIVIPGLASYDAIMDRRRDWGPDWKNHPLYRVRVLGEHVLNEAGKIVSIDALNNSEADWSTGHDQDPESPTFGEWLEEPRGRLRVGVDPAGPGSGGDETAMVFVRGRRVIAVYTWRGLSEEAHLVHLRACLQDHVEPGEVPLVAIDREGAVGIKVWGTIRAYADEHEDELVVVGIRSSDKAQRQPTIYDRVRDELWACASDWIRTGGLIPPDTKLAGELHAPSWSSKIDGLLKATPKDEIRKNLGRSPDRADALGLAVWLREDTMEDERTAGPRAAATPDVYETVDDPIGNPYDALSFDRLRRD